MKHRRTPAHIVAMLLAAVLAAPMVSITPAAAQPDWSDKGGKGKGSDERGGGKGKGHQDRDDRGRDDRDNRGDRGGRTDQRQAAPQVQSRDGGLSIDIFFDDRRRAVVRDYYGDQFRSGNCPPGLAKKNNGCMPPGQARKWAKGRPLPRDVVFYEVPQSLVVRLGVPPAGHKYVRVAADILLIAIGTSMVVDAIQDLGSL